MAERVLEALTRRDRPAGALVDAAPVVARACRDLADRFRRGGKLIAFGSGGPATDAQHVSVEFVHPVIVGKRALPAISLGTDAATVTGVSRRVGPAEVFAHQLSVLARPEDAAIGIADDGDSPEVLRGLEVAHDAGLLTIALIGGDAGGALATSGAVDHAIVIPSEDPHVVKEVQVTAYHVLWELVHVFLDELSGEPAGAGGELEGLYPFLYDGGADAGALLAEVERSTAAKAQEIVALRRRVVEQLAEPIAACASAMSAAFDRGGTLLTFGNGGSSSDAQEVAHSFLDPASRALRPLPAMCLTNDVAVLTALSNDVDFDVVFARQVRAFGRSGDIALGLSTSGNSPNLLKAFEAAKELGMLTVGLAGSDGGAMATAGTIDHLLVVPSSSVHRIQEVQTTLYHLLRELIASG